MYVTSPHLNALALDAATGKLLWKYTPFETGPTRRDGTRVNRGVTDWEGDDDKRILYVAGPRLFALDAETGQPIPEFGEGGWVDLTGASRPLGLRSARASESRHGASRRRVERRRGAGHKDGAPVIAGSGDGRTALPDRGAARPSIDHSG